MVYNVQVQTDPGEAAKEIKIDGKITGSSDSDSNFKDMFERYNLAGKRMFGTKAVVVNLESFFTDLRESYQLHDEEINGIKAKYSPILKDLSQNNYWICFWDKTSQVHHRDIMRLCYEEVRKAAEEYKKEIGKKDYTTSKDLEIIISQIERIERVEKDLKTGLEELYTAKVSKDADLGVTAGKMLKWAQGYQLLSEDIENLEELWKSRIVHIQLSSGITKDQEKHGIAITPYETSINLEHFLGSLKNTEIAASKIELPESHQVPFHTMPVKSTRTHKNGNGYVTTVEDKELRVVYKKD